MTDATETTIVRIPGVGIPAMLAFVIGTMIGLGIAAGIVIATRVLARR